MRKLIPAPWLFALLTTAFPIAALAQSPGDSDSTVVYPANYFTEWSPITAQDMLDRIPGLSSGNGPGSGGPRPGGGGFSGNPASGGRGFGGGDSGSEILVNGKRTAGKNNQTREQLSRIAANQVREIQIIRGTSGELDVRGSSQVINVVLFEELPSYSVSYEANMAYVQDDTMHPGGRAAISGQYGDLGYVLSLSSNPRYNNSLSNESSVLGDFSPNDTVIEERTEDQTQNQLSMNLSYEIGANSSIRLNGLYGISDNPTEVRRVTTNLRTNPVGLLVEREDIPGERDNWELGGDYELSLDNGHRFKLLAIANQSNQDSIRQRWQQFGDGTEQKNLFLGTSSVIEERILRSSYTFDLVDSQNVEFGIERAQTTLDSELQLAILSSKGTPSPALGGLVPQIVPNSDAVVEEIRYEPFVIHNWTLGPRLSLESTLVYESSEISQSGDVVNSRDFDFIKPKLDLRFNVTPALQLRGTIERIVNQLTFADFVAANDDQDEDSNVLAGNAQLRQQTQWRYTFNTEWRLPDDVGVINGEFFYADHQDVIDRLDASTSETSLVSVNGNIGDGKEYGMNLTAGLRMGMIGLPNLLVTPGLNVQDSEVMDPFLGIKRRFQFYQRGRFTLTTRHDIPAWRVNWGFQYFDRIDGGMFRYDVDDIEFSVGEPRVNLFAEYVDNRGLTWRLDLGAITDGTQCRERWRYAGRISANVLEELEYRCTHGGVETSFKVSGTF